ncbi:MAG: hypothetical protein ACRDD8_16430 [Bacteroidales bacterium]
MNIKDIEDVQFFLDYHTTENYIGKLVPYNHRCMLSISRIEMKIDIVRGRSVEYTYCLLGEDPDDKENYRLSSITISELQYNEVIDIYNKEQKEVNDAIRKFQEDFLSGRIPYDR